MPLPFFSPVIICEDTNQPEVDFDHCDPTTLLSEIEKVALGNPQGADFTDITDASELMTRLSQTDTGDDAVRLLTVVGEKPASTPVVINISNGRKRTPAEDNTLTLTVDDISDKIWAYAKYLKQHPYQKLYYFIIQAGKMFYYGNAGIIVEIAVVDTFATGREGILTIVLTMTWRAAPTLPDMIDYPLAVGSSSALGTPGSFAGTVTGTTTTNLSWAAVTGADSYLVQRSTSSAFTSPVDTTVTAPTTVLAVTGLVSGTQYYWRVKAIATGRTDSSFATVNKTTFNTNLSFASSTTPSGGSVGGTASATDADQALSFTAITSPVGTPSTMNVTVSGTLEAVFDYPSDYTGATCYYKDKAGTGHATTFINGTRAL